MSLESPPRLKHGELGPILKAADAAVSPERIAGNHAAIKAAIAGGVASTLPLWVKLGLPLLLVVGGYALYRGLSSEQPAQPKPAPVIVTTASIDAFVVDAVELDAVVVDAVELDAASMKKRAVVVEASPPPIDAAPAPSDLPAQIALYEQARAAAARGEVTRGIDLLDELVQKFPSTQLRAEVELTRADFLTRANRLDEAAAALEALAANPAHRGRRGELYRALGDIRRKQNDCPRALEAYTRAREMKLDASETAKVDRGFERCKKP